MDITGLTGHSGSGKTTVALIMKKQGFYHINCDEIVHNLYTKSFILEKITNAFGAEFICSGELDRRKLGKLIFSDKNEYNKLMALVKDDIISAVNTEIEQNADKHILLDAPTLFEFGMQSICSRIIGVISDSATERICARDGIDLQTAKERLANQQSADFFRQNCDIIIENNGDINELCQKVSEITFQIMKG